MTRRRLVTGLAEGALLLLLPLLCLFSPLHRTRCWLLKSSARWPATDMR
jgi:hypothetical protein